MNNENTKSTTEATTDPQGRKERVVMPDIHWNYRVIEFVEHNGIPWRAIHEVHYEKGDPVGYSENPAVIVWDTDEGDSSPINTLDWMRKALEQPILVETDFKA